MKKFTAVSITVMTAMTLAACGNNDADGTNETSGTNTDGNDTNQNVENNAENNDQNNNDIVNEVDNEENQDDDSGETVEDSDGETIVFGMTSWTSTEVPTNIAAQILEEAGYETEFSMLDQPIIFEGMANEDIDFFMDAWLPYTEEQLWSEYEEDLVQVATSYEEVPLGWVVPEYVDIDTIGELEGNADMFDGEIYSIDPGAGIVSLSEEVMDVYDFHEEYTLTTSSEFAMVAELEDSVNNEEPVIITGWRPHSMFAEYDLKFLEDEEGIFNLDNVYVLSYDGIAETHPRAHEILSEWSIEVGDLEEMMLEYEEEETPFDELAENWIEENRDQVDAMLGDE
ncbi:glycine betaine ABC transporter substrate-binding protein [Alkalicoccus chagannorensis]|uniref:glycine betaine ABC transporter substrate-binding protein n=1 Tax=Alkalicoccus chagannorensis TaxID=427072 RepID=UPI000479ECDA|nr:glycine betaine ABC transporter substrate-binding protein [Alkalicoccus chagannorensis]